MKTFQNILFICENAIDQAPAIARAVSLAKSNQARLTCIDVVTTKMSRFGISPDQDVWQKANALLDQEHEDAIAALIAPHRDDLEIHTEVVRGDARFIEVIRAVLRHDYDLVIKAAEDPAWLDRLFGSDDMHILRKCPCPVWLTKKDEQPRYKNVMATVDFDLYERNQDDDSLNMKILSIAASLAIHDGAVLHVVHAFEASELGFVQIWAEKPETVERQYHEQLYSKHMQAMDGLMWRLKAEIGEEGYSLISPRIHLPEGAAHETIPRISRAKDADIVVMGTVARTGIPGLIIGNTAEAILDQLDCSLIAVKPDGFESPVTVMT